MNGITSSQFLNDPANTLSFQQTVAASISGLSPDDVEINGVNDVTSKRRKLLAATTGIEVNFTAAIATGAQYGKDSASAFAAISSTLDKSVKSGFFAAALAANAAANGATTLQSVSVTQITISNKSTKPPTPSPTPRPTPAPTRPIPFAAGSIAAIVVLLSLALSMLAYLLMHYIIRKELMVENLPINFPEGQLKMSKDGILQIIPLSDGRSAIVVFVTHKYANFVIEQGWYFCQRRLDIRWARPFQLDYYSRELLGWGPQAPPRLREEEQQRQRWRRRSQQQGSQGVRVGRGRREEESSGELEMDELFGVGPAPEDALQIYDDGFSEGFTRLGDGDGGGGGGGGGGGVFGGAEAKYFRSALEEGESKQAEDLLSLEFLGFKRIPPAPPRPPAAIAPQGALKAAGRVSTRVGTGLGAGLGPRAALARGAAHGTAPVVDFAEAPSVIPSPAAAGRVMPSRVASADSQIFYTVVPDQQLPNGDAER